MFSHIKSNVFISDFRLIYWLTAGRGSTKKNKKKEGRKREWQLIQEWIHVPHPRWSIRERGHLIATPKMDQPNDLIMAQVCCLSNSKQKRKKNWCWWLVLFTNKYNNFFFSWYRWRFWALCSTIFFLKNNWKPW